jgi:hypothetical protein
VPAPLNELLTRALDDYTRAFADLPLQLHANLLRLVGDEGIDQREIPPLARVSKRAAKWDVTVAARRGWLVIDGKEISLTGAGRQTRDAVVRGVDVADAAWRTRFGDNALTKLRASLEALVAKFDLELPHYPVGYGPADGSVTGGVAMRWGRRRALRVQGLPGQIFDPVAERGRPSDGSRSPADGSMFARRDRTGAPSRAATATPSPTFRCTRSCRKPS